MPSLVTYAAINLSRVVRAEGKARTKRKCGPNVVEGSGACFPLLLRRNESLAFCSKSNKCLKVLFVLSDNPLSGLGHFFKDFFESSYYAHCYVLSLVGLLMETFAYTINPRVL